jgi:hypothetical protein
MIPRSILEDWLRAQAKAGCTQLVMQRRVDIDARYVRRWRLRPKTDVAALAQKVLVRSLDETLCRPVTQIFGLFAFAPGERIWRDRFTWRIDR